MPPPTQSGPLVEPVEPAEFERPRRSKWLVGGAVTAVLAVGGAGVFAVANLTGSTAGGASTPEDLGAELMMAIENEDVLGAIDTLLPGERVALGEPFVEMVSELQRLDVLAETDLSQIGGLDVDLTGEDISVRATNVDDIVNIDLRADVVVSVDGAELPVGALVTDNLPEDALTELRGTRLTQSDRLDIWLTAVQDDGQWYFSLLHSAAELARAEAAPGTGIPLEGVGADGTDTPEAAVDQVLDRLEALDLTGLIRSLNPGEAAALQRYAPLFLDEANAALAEVPLRWRITERDVRVEGSGETRTAFVDALAIEGDVDGFEFTFAFHDDCIRVSMDRDEFEHCGVDREGLDQFLGSDPDIERLFRAVENAFADIEPLGIELRQHDGKWYVSPFGTLTEIYLAFLRALDREELDEIIAAFEPAFDGLEDALFESMNDLAESGGLVPPIDVPLIDDDFDAVIDDDVMDGDVMDGDVMDGDVMDGDVMDGDVDGGNGVVEEQGWFECYELTTAVDAAACFETYIASGDIEAAAVPVALRHPECGYAEVSWSNEIYSLPDDEFVAAAESARECFLALVETGEVSEYELPSEISHLECFEGRNWYQVFDDPEYDQRYYECLEQGIGD